MLCVNNIKPVNSCNFKCNGRRFAVQIGKKFIDSDTYINNVNKAIFSKPLKSIQDMSSIMGTCNFAQVQLKQTEHKAESDLYKKLIKRCTDDIENAIANREPEEKVDKLTSVLELFIRKFGHLE